VTMRYVITGAASGIGRKKRLEDFTREEFSDVIALNTISIWELAKECLPQLAEAKGSIIAIASIAAQSPGPMIGPYSTSKAGLIMLIRQMALEWGPLGVRSNCVSPGTVMTGLSPQRFQTEEQREQVRAQNTLGILAIPEDIAGVVAFLAGPDARYINGADIVVDGGKLQTLMRGN
jgi:NAD(P)-dependent dehydrogenase (short-subunit alcohol dehydrogenase family)